MIDWLLFRVAIMLEAVAGRLCDFVLVHRYDYCRRHGGHQFAPSRYPLSGLIQCERCGLGTHDAEALA